MTDNAVILDIDQRGVARLTINRPEIHNAFDDALIEQLIQMLERVEADSTIRILILGSEGKSFSAGADLNWMRRMADYTSEENFADAMQLAKLMECLNGLSKPTIARVQGAAFGGGVGLVACCDMAVASDNALFSLSEVRLGLIPAVISPYVVAAIGERASRRYFVTAERFFATQAKQMGLLHEVVKPEQLDETVEKLLQEILKGSPAAQTAAKKLVADVAFKPLNENLIRETAQRITDIRASDEGKEGLNAFLQKRTPGWINKD